MSELTNQVLQTTLDLPFDAAVDAVTAALKEQGFGVLSKIDVQATLKEKIGADFRPYVILGACNPHLAHRAFTTDLDVGLLLPCNVTVYAADGGGSAVSIVDPLSMLGFMESPALQPVADEARRRLQLAMDALKAAAPVAS